MILKLQTISKLAKFILLPSSHCSFTRNTTMPSLGFPRKSSVHRSFNEASFVNRRSLIWGFTLAATTMRGK
ncbi:hypothetical protein GIB67_006422 [Kingdonia uniflora]|uniref:Uncharacterized protein n=1 Tax=Kingdonia uniflora TaxID=39325 RepID=A0A7J7P0T4_9MAGN|nr:hypothetical protein GIB67_006422 [Kingdonia uniflora]